MRIKKLYLGLSLVGAVTLFTGCVSTKPITPDQIIKNSKDKEITKSIIENLKNRKYDIDYNTNTIVIEQYISGEQGSTSHTPREAISRYYSKYDSSTDKIAQSYIEMAKKRGNIIKLYKNRANLEIAKNIPMPWDVRNDPAKADMDNALVEYDKNNRIVSSLIRVHTFPKSLGYLHYRFSIIGYSNVSRVIESKISNSLLKDNYITTIK